MNWTSDEEDDASEPEHRRTRESDERSNYLHEGVGLVSVSESNQGVEGEGGVSAEGEGGQQSEVSGETRRTSLFLPFPKIQTNRIQVNL